MSPDEYATYLTVNKIPHGSEYKLIINAKGCVETSNSSLYDLLMITDNYL